MYCAAVGFLQVAEDIERSTPAIAACSTTTRL
jgi:hypothetical protein